MMAANFFQASNQSREGSENDDRENEDDDDSLYLSAREDSDSFLSATGSRSNLRGTSKYTTILHHVAQWLEHTCHWYIYIYIYKLSYFI